MTLWLDKNKFSGLVDIGTDVTMYIFWQASINDQRPNLRVHINNIVIVGLLDTGADVTFIIL